MFQRKNRKCLEKTDEIIKVNVNMIQNNLQYFQTILELTQNISDVTIFEAPRST